MLFRSLSTAGPTQVLPPLQTQTGHLTTTIATYEMTLYPFIQGTNGFESPRTPTQWTTLGRALKTIHHTELPPPLRKQIRTEHYTPKWRDQLRTHLDLPDDAWPPDPIAQELVTALHTHHTALTRVLTRAQELAPLMTAAQHPFVLCHGDIHAGNVMLTNDDTLFIVDWDNPVIAPKERDLMYIGAGIGPWNDSDDYTAFHQGYGNTTADPLAIAYYRYERIVEDSALFCAEARSTAPTALTTPTTLTDDRAQNLHFFLSQFTPNSVITSADAAYDRYTTPKTTP